MNNEFVEQVKEELRAVGVGSVAMHTPESKALAAILHPGEHIGGVVYGRYSGGLAWLIATDQRILFLDHKPLFKTTDEITYTVVSGVRSVRAGLFFSVMLHTRLGDYTVRYVNAKSARIFVDYIETRGLQTTNSPNNTDRIQSNSVVPILIANSDDGLRFLRAHDLAVLSTVDRTGNVHGANVYYCVDQANFVYILTKSDTAKGRNIYAHAQVALTVHEPGTSQTLQLEGIAEVVTNQTVKDEIFTRLVQPRHYNGGTETPPVSKLHEGSFMVIKIGPTLLSFHDYTQLA